MHTIQPRALVTGASRGIGKAIALALAHRKFSLALVARNEGLLHEVCRACEQAGGKAQAIVADLAEPQAAQHIAQETSRRLGGLDVLVNNAGLVRFEGVEQADLPAWDTLMNVNVRAVMHLTHHVLPMLKQGKAAAVINIASVASRITYAGGALHCASKHALLAFSNALFEDVRDAGIKVSAICPGYVETDMLKGANLAAERAIRPDDIAQAALFVLDSGQRACPTEIVIHSQQNI